MMVTYDMGEGSIELRRLDYDLAPQQSAQNVMVEILVESQPDHSQPSAGLWMPCEETGAHALGVETRFVFQADGVSLRRPPLQVGCHPRLMPEKIADYGIHVRQCQAGIF